MKKKLDIEYELKKIWIMLTKHEKMLEKPSRQYKYQLERHKQNKCMICGKKEIFKAWRCKKCYIKRQLT